MNLQDQLKENGLHILLYEKDGIDMVPLSRAVEFTIVRWEPYAQYRGQIPKRRALDLGFILEFVAKKDGIQYINYCNIFKKLNLPNVGYYPTSYGVGVEVIFGERKETNEAIEHFLQDEGIEYTNEYSNARWVYRYKFSKTEANIKRIMELSKN